MGADNILGNRIVSVYLSHAAGSAWSKEISTAGLQANIHELTTGCRGIHAEDELYQENATLEKGDRREIVKAIQALESGSPANYVVDVSEMFCPPRLTARASRHGLRGGVAMDLRTGYNFDLEADRREATEHVDIDKPQLILLSPKCSVRSQLQRLNQRRRDPESLARDVATRPPTGTRSSASRSLRCSWQLEEDSCSSTPWEPRHGSCPTCSPS